MGDVLSDEQLLRTYEAPVFVEDGSKATPELMRLLSLRRVKRAVVAALAARSGVDVETLVATAAKATHCCCRQVSEEEWDHSGCLQHCQYPMIEWDAAADALRLALAQQEAWHAESRHNAAESTQRYVESILREHAEREAMWRELRELERIDWVLKNEPIENIEAQSRRIVELRRALGLEGE